MVLGEGSHEDNAVAGVLFDIKLIESLKKAGIKIIVTEHLYEEHIQQLLVDPEKVMEHLDRNAFMRISKEHSPSKKMVSFLQNCQKQGITVLSLDNKEIYKHNKKGRVPLLNYKTLELIEGVDVNSDSKVLVYIGAAHTNHYNDKEKETIGITEILPEAEEIIIKYSYCKLDLSSVKNGLVFSVVPE